ncbi:MAG TPA: hypothetical protein VHV30_06895 [Polyangiaceae bacterium]|nr:hypothetical protein [Polyangiaceae bacterium]
MGLLLVASGASCSSASSPTSGGGDGLGNASSGSSGQASSTSSGGGSGGGSSGTDTSAGDDGVSSSGSSGGGDDVGQGSSGDDASGSPGPTDDGGGGGGAKEGGSPSGGGAGTDPTMLPTATGTCPQMANLNGTNVAFGGQQFTVWSGDPAKGPGPLLVYWFATGSNSMEPTWAIQTPQIQRITAAGGAVIAMVASTKMGTNTGDNVWYTGDVTVADQAVACAVQTQKIDTRRIWAAGYSAGALQTVYMWYARSGYLSGVISYSGGDITVNRATLQDPNHLPVGLASHGAAGQDVIVVDFNQGSHTWEMQNPKAFIVDCDDGGNHLSTTQRTAMAPQAIQMLWDHPFGVTPEPYASGLPSGWPSDCVPPPVPASH